MAAPEARFVLWVGLELRDEAGYARYRAAMMPLLERFGGRFDWDFRVSEVLRGPEGARVDRVFALSFPHRGARERFFADPAYLEVRERHFAPAVGSVATLAEIEPRPD